MTASSADLIRRVRAAPVHALIFVIELYRNMVSPLRLPSCRFTPTCSRYAVDVLSEYGLIRGGWLAGVRLAKCGPWHPGGWDPMPERTGLAMPGGRDSAPGVFPAGQREDESVV